MPITTDFAPPVNAGAGRVPHAPAGTKVEVLPAQRSSPSNALTWEPGEVPGAGTLTVDTARARVRYAAAEFPTAWAGRAFRLAKLGPGTDRESEAYSVFVGVNPADHACDCKGHTYGHGRPCKHVLACRALVANRWV